MGLVVCPKHGNGFLFVCPHIVAAVLSDAACPGVEYLGYFAKDDQDLEGLELGCWFCPECVAEHNLPPSGTTFLDPDGLRIPSALYRPMCPGCFDEWREGVQLDGLG
jgi:hypothetical protein